MNVSKPFQWSFNVDKKLKKKQLHRSAIGRSPSLVRRCNNFTHNNEEIKRLTKYGMPQSVYRPNRKPVGL